MKGKLYGVGVGPGDPELLTLKALRVLGEADTVVTPRGGRESLAYQIVEPYIRGELLYFHIPMGKEEEREKSFRECAQAIRTRIEEGKKVAFVTLGDPLLYSTFVILWRYLQDVEMEIVPGVSSFLAGASSLKMPLAQGKESLAIVHGERVNEVVLEHFENLVILKITKNYDVLLETLKKWGFSGGMATRLGFPQEMASSDWEQFRGKKLDYFSLLLAKKVER